MKQLLHDVLFKFDYVKEIIPLLLIDRYYTIISWQHVQQLCGIDIKILTLQRTRVFVQVGISFNASNLYLWDVPMELYVGVSAKVHNSSSTWSDDLLFMAHFVPWFLVVLGGPYSPSGRAKYN